MCCSQLNSTAEGGFRVPIGPSPKLDALAWLRLFHYLLFSPTCLAAFLLRWRRRHAWLSTGPTNRHSRDTVFAWRGRDKCVAKGWVADLQQQWADRRLVLVSSLCEAYSAQLEARFGRHAYMPDLNWTSLLTKRSTAQYPGY